MRQENNARATSFKTSSAFFMGVSAGYLAGYSALMSKELYRNNLVPLSEPLFVLGYILLGIVASCSQSESVAKAFNIGLAIGTRLNTLFQPCLQLDSCAPCETGSDTASLALDYCPANNYFNS